MSKLTGTFATLQLLLAAGLATSSPVVAQEAPPAEDVSATSTETDAGPADEQAEEEDAPTITVAGEKDPGSKLICTRVVETGSIMPRKICKTVAQIEEERKQSVEGVRLARERMDAEEASRMRKRDGQP